MGSGRAGFLKMVAGGVLLSALIGAGVWYFLGGRASMPYSGQDAARVQVLFEGGHETDPVDHGRPVVLIAAGLRVPPEVFREAFSRVRPAPGGTRPSGERVRENKAVLMAALGPRGVTNDRLDYVSNYYRYNPGRGELWPVRPARVFALVEDGVVTGFEIEDGGSGYSSAPRATVPGLPGVELTVTLVYGTTLEENGAVAAVQERGAR